MSYYYASFDGKSPRGYGMITKAAILDYKAMQLNQDKRYGIKRSYRGVDWFMEYLLSHTDRFSGDAGIILDEKGRMIVRWTRSANRWGPQWKDYRKPF